LVLNKEFRSIKMPKYTRQIVVFIDILGFSSMLPAFEREALENDAIGEEGYHESGTLNKLVEIFNGAVKLIKRANCKAYQFSDNLCITINYINNDTESPDLLVEMLKLVSMLMFEFVKEGYFLRGGIDAGWFLDADDIAVGVPLVVAYRLESEQAVYPRALLSERFIGILDEYSRSRMLSDTGAFLAEYYIANDGKLRYLNPFFYITNFEDKEGKIDYLRTYSVIIKEKLQQFKGDTRIEPKYSWLANEFNQFIDKYVTGQAYLELDDDQLDYTDSEIKFIQSLKISLHGV
jgi:hypothetical protein